MIFDKDKFEKIKNRWELEKRISADHVEFLLKGGERLVSLEDFREVKFCGTLLSGLVKAYKHCASKQSTELFMEDFKSLLTQSEYARFNDLVRFDLLSKPEKKNGCYKLNVKKSKEFLRGEDTIIKAYFRNKTTKEIIPSTEKIGIDEVPSVDKLREEMGDKFTRYKTRETL